MLVVFLMITIAHVKNFIFGRYTFLELQRLQILDRLLNVTICHGRPLVSDRSLLLLEKLATRLLLNDHLLLGRV